MNTNKILRVLFSLSALCFGAGTINHIFNTGEGVFSSLLLMAGSCCAAYCFYKK